MKRSFVLMVWLWAGLFLSAQAQTTSEPKNRLEGYPDFEFRRARENYGFLANRSSKNFWESLKYISLGQNPDAYLSLGSDIRSEFQVIQNLDWDEANDDDGVLFQRFMFHLDLHLGKHIRLFGQLKSGFMVDRNAENSPLDTDEIDVHQLFATIQLGSTRLEVGRRELWYGSRRLISIREGTNIRQSFDGARWIWQKPQHRFDALFYYYNPQQMMAFDNGFDNNNRLWGGYYVWNVTPDKKLNFDFYYLGVQNETTRFESGNDRETRHSVGFRHWGKMGKLRYNNEALFQFGRFGNQSISAWTASSEIYYTLVQDHLSPTLGLKVDIVSGDESPNDGVMQTFNPLYPRGGYFGLLALIGPANLIDLHPSFQISFGERWEFSFDWDFFWRYSTQDGIYFPSGRLNVASQGSQQKFIGHQIGGEVVFKVNRFLELETSCFYFTTGGFLNEVTSGADILQLGASMNFKF